VPRGIILEAVFHRYRRITDGAPANDDRTLVLLKV